MRIYLLLFSVLLMFSCKDNAVNQNTTPEPEVVAPTPSTAAPLTMINAYTSSEVAFNEAKQVFDDNLNTMWVSKPGMNQGEYIEANFLPSEQVVHKIGLKMEHMGPIARIFRYRAYVNGKFIGEYKYDELVPVNQKIESLKIQFSLVDKMQDVITYKNNKSFRVVYSDSKTSVGVSEIWLFDKAQKPIKINAPQVISAGMDASLMGLFDNRPETGFGGEKIMTGNFRLTSTKSVDKLVISNGSPIEYFGRYSRPKQLKLTVDSTSQIVDIQDIKGHQIIELETPMTGQNYTFEILDFYPGEGQPFAMNRLAFMEKGKIWKPFKIENKIPEKKLAAGTILSSLVNRHFANTWRPEKLTYTNTINLRSTGFFDLEKFRESGQQSIPVSKVVGYWSVISNDDKKAVIQLTGGMDDFSGKLSKFGERITITPEGFFRKDEKENIYIK